MEYPDPITVIDNFLSESDHKGILDYCKKAKYAVGGGDTFGSKYPSGTWHTLSIDHNITEFFKTEIIKRYESLQNSNIFHAGINCYLPRELTFFHEDFVKGQHPYTILYYPNVEEYDLNEGGWTEILYEERIVGIQPKPNRLLFMDSRLTHRATPFRSNLRFTVTFRLSNF